MTSRCRPALSRPVLWCLLCLTCAGGNLLSVADAAEIEVYYAPEDEPLTKLSAVYDHASRYIYVAVYGLTSPLAVKGLVDAKKRGLDVRVITDRERLDDQKQKAAVNALHLAGIPILINQHDGLMHLKKVVIDDEINVSGSMNHTGSGNRYNDERLDVIHDRPITAKAREKFLTMWKDRQRYHLWEP